MTNIPKIMIKGIRIPAGPFEGVLALPCPCGDTIEFNGDRDLYLARNSAGKMIFYHEGCIVHLGGGENDA